MERPVEIEHYFAENTDYLALINQTIDTEIANYVLPVYNINKLKDFEKDIELTIKYDLF